MDTIEDGDRKNINPMDVRFNDEFDNFLADYEGDQDELIELLYKNAVRRYIYNFFRRPQNMN